MLGLKIVEPVEQVAYPTDRVEVDD